MSNQLVAGKENKMMTAFELEGIKSQLQSLLDGDPKKIQAFKTRIIKISLNYMLRDCSPESIINCGLQALTLNLPLEGGQGYIVNYGGVAQLDPGYKGWQLLAKRVGFSVLADVVYACDSFNQDGFGFDREMNFSPNYEMRNSSNDKWAKENLTGVIVSIREDKTESTSIAFVPADMIFKIVGKSPSTQTEKGRAHSPHENWAEQMFCGKAIKQVLTKFPIDLSEAAQLHQAITITNQSESLAQQAAKAALNEYPQDRFDELYPKWKEIVQSGKKKAVSIITQLSNSYSLTSCQMEKAMELKQFEPIDAEVSEGENHVE